MSSLVFAIAVVAILALSVGAYAGYWMKESEIRKLKECEAEWVSFLGQMDRRRASSSSICDIKEKIDAVRSEIAELTGI